MARTPSELALLSLFWGVPSAASYPAASAIFAGFPPYPATPLATPGAPVADQAGCSVSTWWGLEEPGWLSGKFQATGVATPLLGVMAPLAPAVAFDDPGGPGFLCRRRG